MHEDTRKFMSILFNPDEEVCVSDCQGGYHSVPQDFSGKIELISPKEEKDVRFTEEDRLVLIAINPISGFRRDENVTAFRSFLVELDDGSLKEQLDYVRDMGMPYSACVFSGNKSLHFAITLDQDLPSYDLYYDVAEWILNIMKKADQKTKNPTRSIRYPNNKRRDGKKLVQKLVELKGRVSYEDLAVWLQKYPNENPAEIRKNNRPKYTATIDGIPSWVLNKLTDGIDESRGRNNEWFGIAMELAKAGYSDEEMIAYAQDFFVPDRDFGQSEWESIMKHAYKRVMRKNG